LRRLACTNMGLPRWSFWSIVWPCAQAKQGEQVDLRSKSSP
jgi:hypothetical protein